MVFISFIIFIIGLLVLAKSSSILVDGSSSIAKNFRISPVIIGLTIVAFATSAPELTVSVSAALSGSTEIALGNVIGSNIVNTLVILGLSALIFPLAIRRNIVWREIPFSLLAAFLVFIFAIFAVLSFGVGISFTGTEVIGYLTRFNGLILLGFFIAFIVYVVKNARKGDPETANIKSMSLSKAVLYTTLGTAGLILSSKYLVVDSAITIATALGMSQTLIGLTLVAIGTSLPELSASLAAALKKNSDIVIGNIVGSNIFNLLLILGTTLFIKQVPVTGQNIFDIIFLLFITIILFVLVFVLSRYKLNRGEGAFLLIIYILYSIYIFVR